MVTALAAILLRSGNPCLRFDGDAQVAIVPFQKSMDVDEITVEAWIYVDESSRERFFNYVVCRNYGDFGWGVALHGSPVKVFSQAAKTEVPIGRWTHIAMACSKRAGKFYVDGDLAAAWERNGPLKPFTHELMIGNSDMFGAPGNQPTPFRGSIDELRIWRVARSQAEIRRTMSRRLRGRERHLLAYFPFDEGKGQIVHDYTGHLLSGSLGASYLPGSDDPTWADGPPLRGRRPALRVH